MLPQNVSGQTPAPASAGEATEQEPLNIQTGETSGQGPKEQQQGQFDEATYRKIAREEAAKIAQSFTDKASNRIMQQVQEQIAALEMSAGALGLTDEQVEKAKQNIVIKAMTAKPQGAQASAPGQTANEGQHQAGMHPIMAQAIGMMQAEGMSIDDGDPEFVKFIQPLLGEPEPDARLLRAMGRALDAKSQRLASTQAAAAARVASGAGGGGKPNPKPLTAEEKISKGLAGNWPTQEPPANS